MDKRDPLSTFQQADNIRPVIPTPADREHLRLAPRLRYCLLLKHPLLHH
jgi:hypothetical protein